MASITGRLNTIINDNLTLLDGETQSALERRLAQLRDRALLITRGDSLFSNENRVEEFRALFEEPVLPADAPQASREYLTAYARSGSFSDKLTVCKFLAEEFSGRSGDILATLLDCTPGAASPKIAYFKNAYADAAFRIFSQVYDSPSVTYASDFTAVCEEVYYGRADMCLLPMDSSRDAKLISFYRLIDKYELNPVFSCDVTSPDGSVTTRYALLKKSIGLPTDDQLKKIDCCFFEFSLIPDQCATLGDVLLAAGECGLTLYKVDSIPLTYSDSEFSCDIIMRVDDKKGLDAFVLFLTLAVPQYEPLGIYPHIGSGS